MRFGGERLETCRSNAARRWALTLLFSIIKALGVIILGWGIVQVGMSIQSHDASQRTQGLLCLFGGLLITFAKEILTLIGAV